MNLATVIGSTRVTFLPDEEIFGRFATARTREITTANNQTPIRGLADLLTVAEQTNMRNAHHAGQLHPTGVVLVNFSSE